MHRRHPAVVLLFRVGTAAVLVLLLVWIATRTCVRMFIVAPIVLVPWAIHAVLRPAAPPLPVARAVRTSLAVRAQR